MKLKATYHDEKDILYLQILPPRPARVDETKYGLMVRYDWDKPHEVVGFECLDFSLLWPSQAWCPNLTCGLTSKEPH